MNCPNCGTQLPEGTTFCENCGTPIAPQQAQDVNNALFNQEPVYTVAAAPKKKRGVVIGVIIAVLVLAIAAGVILFMLGRYNGTYKFASMSFAGMEYNIDQLSEISEMSGESINMSLKVSFTKCTLDMDALGYKHSGDAKIKFSNNKVILSNDDGDEIKGTYNSNEKSITLNIEGIEMKFIKE